MKTNIVSTTGPVEYRNMYSISDKSKILSGFDEDEIIEEIFESLVQSYQVCEESMKGNNFLLDGVKRLHYKCQKISLKRGESYIDSPQWLKIKRVIINPLKQQRCVF